MYKQFFNSNIIKTKKLKFKRLKAKLQSKGTLSAKRLLKKISGKEQRFMKYWNHVISKEIIKGCETGDTIILENLKGIRKTNQGKTMNYWISNWSFHQLQNFIEYKATHKGIEVVRVKPNFTSQICHRCGRLGSRLKGCFCCNHCGFLCIRDL